MHVPEAELVQFSGIYTKRYKILWDGEAGRGQNQENMEQARIKNVIKRQGLEGYTTNEV